MLVERTPSFEVNRSHSSKHNQQHFEHGCLTMGERTYVPRYLCSPVPLFPEPMFPGMPYLCSPVPMFPGFCRLLVSSIHRLQIPPTPTPNPPGDCSLVRRFCSPKVRESEIKGYSFRRFCSPKVRKSDDDFYSFLL